MRPFLTLHDPAKARDYYRRGLWRDETLYDLLVSHAASRPDVLATRDGRRRLTWRELVRWVDVTAAHLDAARISGGDRVSIWSDNRVETIVLLLACARNGIACNPSLHRTYTSAEVAQLLDRLDAKLLLTRPGWGADGRAGEVNSVLQTRANPAAGGAPRVIWTPESFPEPDDSPHPETGTVGSARPPQADPDKVMYLAFTSGTTGAPKCVMHSDNTLLANARDLARDWEHGPATRLLSLSPLSHHIAWVGVAQWLICGCELITDDPPPGRDRLDWLIETGATYVMGVPTHAMDILAEQRRRGLAHLGAVKMFYMAGAAIPPSVAQAFVAQGIKPQNVYGMTENSSHQYTHPDDETGKILTTCGRGGPGYNVRVFDPAEPDREVPCGTVGEIGGRGAALMLGYFDNQTATERSFNRGGWFMSGDLGSLDEGGNLRIEGRLKDLIIRGGHNIYPSQIEALALRHPDVGRCAAFPVPDERLGERVCIAVLGPIAADALLHHLAAEGLSKYDMPEFFVRMTVFPLTASGKILKRELIELARAGRISPTPVRYRAKEAE